jgi:hypothetical protein
MACCGTDLALAVRSTAIDSIKIISKSSFGKFIFSMMSWNVRVLGVL